MLRVGGGKERRKGSYGLLGVFGVFAVGVFSNWQLSLRSRRRFNYAGMKWPSAHYVGGRHRSTCSRIHALRSVGRGWSGRGRLQHCANFSECFKAFLEHRLLVRPPHAAAPLRSLC